MKESRYPYTYAADFLRMKVGDDYGKGLISRSAAAKCHHEIAKVIGIDETKMAEMLADAFLKEQE